MSNDVALCWEDVEVGQDLPSMTIPVTRTSIVRYAGAGGDFNPVHHDEVLAKSLGLPSVFAMGLMHGSMLSRIVTDWAGVGTVKRYSMRFKGMVWPGDSLTCSGKVLDKREEGEEHLVDCELAVHRAGDDAAIEGKATVSLPSRNMGIER